MGSSFGSMFNITTFGESHGAGVGVIVDGCPAGLNIDVAAIQYELDRRRPGQSDISTQRKEGDVIDIMSGVVDGVAMGTPIAMMVRNLDQKSHDYNDMANQYRPSHADYTYDMKYGRRDWRGGGRSSARETLARVAAGAIAKQFLQQCFGVQVLAFVQQIGSIAMPHHDFNTMTLEQIEANVVRCPHPETAERMHEAIRNVRKEGDSLGGVVVGLAKGVPAGWGEPVFDKLEALLAHAMLSIPACKGFESGSGFQGVLQKGSEHNDVLIRNNQGQVQTKTNHAGGIVGGISNGETIVIRTAFKPTATIIKEQQTLNRDLEPTTLRGRGRHDPCVVPRAVPIVEAMMALVLADMALCQRARANETSQFGFLQDREYKV